MSELAIEIQKLKYKSEELRVYYGDQHCIDLSNIDSLLINTVKERVQGTLLDKIYDERNLGNIIVAMNKRRFEDTCIRSEFRKYNKIPTVNNGKSQNVSNSNQNNFRQGGSNFNNNRQGNSNQNNYKQGNLNPNYNRQGNFNPNYNRQGYGSPNHNRSGYFAQGNYRNNYNQPQYQGQNRGQNQMSGNLRMNPGQNRFQQDNFKQRQGEPMEVDNIEGANEKQKAGAFFMN